MKILLVIQMLLGIFLIANDANSGVISCFPENTNDTFNCHLDEFDIELREVNDINAVSKTLDLLIDDPLSLPVKNVSYDFDKFLELMSNNQPTPHLGHWNLPAYTLLSLQNKGIKSIMGKSIETLISYTKDVHWQDIFYLDLLNRFEPQRHTGFYNSITNNVVFDGSDLRGRSLSDIKHWALHEFFGTANIDDKNYELSTMATLVNDGHMTAAEFNKMQYKQSKFTFPKKYMRENYNPKVRLMSFPFGAHNRDAYARQEGGITGVEGGGDIVSASIKRYMLHALKESKDVDSITAAEVKALLAYDVHYTNFVIYSLPHHQDGMKTAPIYKGHEKGKPILVLKKSIRDTWPELSHQEKLELGREYLKFLNIGINKVNYQDIEILDMSELSEI